MSDDVITCYLSLTSPWSFLGGARLQALAARHEKQVDVRPIDAGQVFPISGGLPLARRAPQRQAYRLVELDRWRRHLGIALILEPRHFPTDDGQAQRLVVAAGMGGHDALVLATAFGAALWVDDRDIAEQAVQHDVLQGAGLDVEALIRAAASEATRSRHEAFTQAAIEQGVFGMPTYIYRGEPFWGQDRLDFLERAVATP